MVVATLGLARHAATERQRLFIGDRRLRPVLESVLQFACIEPDVVRACLFAEERQILFVEAAGELVEWLVVRCLRVVMVGRAELPEQQLHLFARPLHITRVGRSEGHRTRQRLRQIVERLHDLSTASTRPSVSHNLPLVANDGKVVRRKFDELTEQRRRIGVVGPLAVNARQPADELRTLSLRHLGLGGDLGEELQRIVLLVGARPEERHIAERVVPEPAHGIALLGHPVFGCKDCLIQQVDRLLLVRRCLGQIEGAPGNLVERKGIDVPLGELRGALVGLHRSFRVAHPEVELADHEVGLRQILRGREVHSQRLEHLPRTLRVVGLKQIRAKVEEHRVDVGVGVAVVGVKLRVERDRLLGELRRVEQVVRCRFLIGSGARRVFLGLLEGLVTTVVGALLVVPRPIVVEFCQSEEIVGARAISGGRGVD